MLSQNYKVVQKMAGPISSTPGVVNGLQSLSTTAADSEPTADEVSATGASEATDTLSLSANSAVASLNAVTASVSTATSTADIAIAAGNQVSDLLTDLNSLATTAADPATESDSLTELDSAFASTLNEIQNTLNAAEFEGTNALLGDNITAVTAPTTPEITVIEGADLSLGGDIISLTADTNISTPTAAETVLPAIENSIAAVTNSIDDIAAGTNQLSAIGDFTQNLSAAVDVSVSSLIDSELDQGGASLLAGQVTSGLADAPLSLANNDVSEVIQLFGSSLG